MGHRLVHIKATLIVQELISHLDVALLQLSDGHLLFDQLKEQFLLIANALTRLDDFLLALLDNFC